MSTETQSLDSPDNSLLEMSESELEAALGSLGLQGEPKVPDSAAPAPVAEEQSEVVPEEVSVPEVEDAVPPSLSEDNSEAPSPAAKAADIPTDIPKSRVTADISEKLSTITDMARTAIESGEFVSARKLLDEIPANRRTPKIKELYEQSKGMMEYEQLWLKAKKFVQKEDYVAAMEVLESIPEELRTKQMTNMLHVAQNQATVTLAIQNAKETLKEYHFKGAIEILEGVPKERRSEALIQLLRETYRITRRLDDLRLEGESRFQKALMGISMEHLESEEDSFDKVLKIYKEILELCPIDEEARDRAEKASNYIEMTKEREELQEYARLHVEDKHFRDALECLQKVHPDVQTGPIREQIMELEGIIEKIDELREAILQDFETSEFSDTAESFDKLKELHEGEYDRLLKEILSGGLEGSLSKVFNKLKESETEDSALVSLLDYLINAIKQDDFEDLMLDGDENMLDHYPVSGRGLYLKLIKILSNLTEDPERFQIRLDLLKKYREHLKEAEPNLTAWEEMLEALEHFNQLQAMP
ncbi:MAG: hypothetical protein R3C11_01680 [Planctomycetaceae bacterium]